MWLAEKNYQEIYSKLKIGPQCVKDQFEPHFHAEAGLHFTEM